MGEQIRSARERIGVKVGGEGKRRGLGEGGDEWKGGMGK